MPSSPVLNPGQQLDAVASSSKWMGGAPGVSGLRADSGDGGADQSPATMRVLILQLGNGVAGEDDEDG